MRRVIITGILITIIAALVTGTGCSSKESTRLPETGRDALLMLMKMLPESIDNLYVYDLRIWREDENYERGYVKAYKYLQDEYGFGSFLDRVDYFGFRDNPNMYIFVGSSEEIDQEKPLELILYPGFPDAPEYGEYKGVTVWMNSYTQVVFENIRIWGRDDEVRGCIDVVVDGAPSLYQREGFASVVDRLPEGVNYGVWYPDYDPNAVSIGLSEKYDGSRFVSTYIDMLKDGTYTERTEHRDHF